MFTAKGTLKFTGRENLVNGLLSILVSLKFSGTKLIDLKGHDGDNLLVESGVVSFEVTGTQDEVAKFKRAYENK
jgi:hypothetical protein